VVERFCVSSPWCFVLSTQYFVLSALILLVAIVCSGCSEPPSSAVEAPAIAEPSFADQLDAVRRCVAVRIQVEASPLSDRDLQQLAGADLLHTLQVDHADSRITAAGIQHLAALPNLDHLRLRGPGIDDAALAEIAKLGGLRILNAPRGEFTDDGLASLKALPDLEQLRFGSPNVSDAGIKTLAELPALKRLHLIGVPITDAGLAELAKLEQLESLYIDDIELSDAAWDALFRARPALHVHINQHHHDRDPHRHPH
jgi:hypothetical protein